MTQTIDKIAEKHTDNEMLKRDGETAMAVGLFILALSIPVLIGTLFALHNPRGAIVNTVCGLVLLFIGGGATGYGWKLFRKATKKAS